MDNSHGINGLVETLSEEHRRLLEEYEEVRGQLLIFQHRESELAELIEACAKLLAANGIAPDSIPDTRQDGVEGARNDFSSSSEVRKHSVEQRGDRVVGFLQSIYPREMHFRDIYKEMERHGVVRYGKDPANALLASYSSDERLERVARGTYRAKPPLPSSIPQPSIL